MRFSHVNIVTKDWKRLSKFYMDVFGCVVEGPVRHLSGAEVSKGTGVANAHIDGVHLKLPGCTCGPTLEIFEYDWQCVESVKLGNSRGITHLAFEVSDLEAVCSNIIRCGGSMLGRMSIVPVEGLGTCTFVYARDVDRNIIEVQSWENHEKNFGAI
ncbi:VOC family protein [Pseudomonas sp. CM25]|uniref:VOC family protein n=1 Tax=Pseudomonas sp. CM25 TaxID=2738448 RepID=UPI001554D012|nr:VOC family protein [Pseudomonas sp. CM25]NQD56491.1 VOC family protein [Pseudomonas sp. CM25]